MALRCIGVWLAALFLALAQPAMAQYWMQQGGGLTIENSTDIALDNSGAVYTVGFYTGSATFGGTTLTAAGFADVFLTKVDASGNFVWAVSAGGTGVDQGLSISTDGAGNSYICGYFTGSATFGGQTIVAAGQVDAFVAKYDTNGNLLWVTSAGSTGFDAANGIAVDATGQVAVTGEFVGTVSFGSDVLTSINISKDVFISRLNGTTGAFLWTEQGAGQQTDIGRHVGTDNQGNVYVAGLFSNNITFGTTHANNQQNVQFLVKYDSLGNEDWFRIIGGAISSSVTGLATNGSGDVWLTGDFAGAVLNFSGPTPFNLTSTDPEHYYIARYTSQGALFWAIAQGSQSGVNPHDLTIDANDNCYVAGQFSCQLGEFADQYGGGTFIALDEPDAFVAKYDTAGTWLYARNLASSGLARAQALAVDPAEDIHLTGWFESTLIVPVSGGFDPANLALYPSLSCPTNNGYCGDPDYGEYASMTTAGNFDVFIGKMIDPNREPYDFYLRSGTTCNRERIAVKVDSMASDSLMSCSSVEVIPVDSFCAGIGPKVGYSYSLAGSAVANPINNPGNIVLVQHLGDSCLTTADTFNVSFTGQPSRPLISDDVGVNSNVLSPSVIELCGMVPVTLTGSGISNNAPLWQGPGLGTGINDSVVTVTQEGAYSLTLTDPNGCFVTTGVVISFFDSLEVIDLRMFAPETLQVCLGDSFRVWVYDSISNPTANAECLDFEGVTATNTWTVNPFANFQSECNTFNNIFPLSATPQLYTITATVVRSNVCDTDTVVVTDQVFVDPLLPPIVPPFNISIDGPSHFCPGDSAWLVGSGPGVYSWFGPGVINSSADSIRVGSSTTFQLSSSLADTSAQGCVNTQTEFTTHTILEKAQPAITASDLFLCPNDSVLLTDTASGATTGFQWSGPNGQIVADTNAIFVTEPGNYLLVINDQDSCGLVSNTITISPNTVAGIQVQGDSVLCDGDSVVISVVANSNAVITWQAPLSGAGVNQTIVAPGVYSASILSCNTTTTESIEIIGQTATAAITGQSVICRGGTTTLTASPGQTNYSWLPGGQNTATVVVADTGLYRVQTTDAFGCTALSAPFVVTENTDLVDAPTGVDGGACFGTPATLMATALQGEVVWLLGADTVHVGDTLEIDAVLANTTYQIVAVADGCVSNAGTVSLIGEVCNEIVVPNVMTPNGDGSNDEFTVELNGNGCYSCQIYNRWGHLIYTLDRPEQGWDGTVGGTGMAAPNGTYYAVINYCQFDQTMRSVNTEITLLR